jgi:hypothetical protein
MAVSWKKLSYSDHIHGNATTSGAGFLSTTDKSKLDGIASGATNYSHPTGDGNLHVPANGTTNSGKVLTAGASAGVYTWQTSTGSGTGSGIATKDVYTLLTNREFTQAISTPIAWEACPNIDATTALDPDSMNFMMSWTGRLNIWISGSNIPLLTRDSTGWDLVFGIKSTGQLFLDLMGTHWTESVDNISITDSLYHCLAVTYSIGATQTIVKFFLDGYTLGADQVFNNIGAISPGGALHISGTYVSTIKQETTRIYIYNRAPSETEMLNIYLLGADTPDFGVDKTLLGNYGSLTSAKRYRIISYAAGDNFNSVGGTNVTGNEFVATAVWPDTWANGSTLMRIGALLQLEPGGINKNSWKDFSNSLYVTYSPSTTFIRKPLFDDSPASNQIFGDPATSGVSDYAARADHKHGIPTVVSGSGGTYQLTDESTIAIDWSNGNTQYVALSDVGRTITFSNPVEGEVYRLLIIQTGGSKTITTWPTIKWAAGSAPTLTITDGKTDIVTLLYANSIYYADCNVNF